MLRDVCEPTNTNQGLVVAQKLKKLAMLERNRWVEFPGHAEELSYI